MLLTDVAKVAEAAKNKAELCNNHFGKYFMRAVMAGFYIVVATILSNVSAAVLYSTYPQFGKLLGAFLFSLAIVLVVFLNGELFTGNNFVMAVGVYNKTVSVKDMIKVWVVSYIGNFVGAFLLSAMFVYSKASHAIMVDYYNSFIYSKISAGVPELLLRGILCNFLVCMAVLVGTKLKSEEKLNKTGGERVILTFEGEKPFLLVEETVKQEDELTIIPTMGEPYMFMDTIGALSDNSLTWSSGNMEYYLVSDVMNLSLIHI